MILRKQCLAPKKVKILELNCEDTRLVFVKTLSILNREART